MGSVLGFGQENDKISTIDFVQILNGNRSEALYFYENNWKVLREMAVKKGYINSYQLLEDTSAEGDSFQIMLITTYANEEQYELREENFRELIEERGKLRLLNQKKPEDFRKTLFHKDMISH